MGAAGALGTGQINSANAQAGAIMGSAGSLATGVVNAANAQAGGNIQTGNILTKGVNNQITNAAGVDATTKANTLASGLNTGAGNTGDYAFGGGLKTGAVDMTGFQIPQLTAGDMTYSNQGMLGTGTFNESGFVAPGTNTLGSGLYGLDTIVY